MKSGDIVLIPFPFAELTNRKVRPAIVVCETKDQFQDLVLCAISSVVHGPLSDNELLLTPTLGNGLRKPSVLKIDRIVTAKKNDVIARLGELNANDLANFKIKFKRLVD